MDVVPSSSVAVSVGEIGAMSGNKCAPVDADVAAFKSTSLARLSEKAGIGHDRHLPEALQWNDSYLPMFFAMKASLI